MADEIDIANDLIDSEVSRALSKIRKHQTLPLKGAKHCIECGEDIPLARQKLGFVLCGGDLSGPTLVNEQYLLDMERRAFLELCTERKTLERLQSIITTGKVLRN